MIGMMADKLN